MNFHKTIGFLATLLLVFGLGVPDSYAQDVSNVSITLNPSSIVDTAEETTVTATVGATLAAPAEVNMSVTVSVSDITADETDDNDATGYGTIGDFDVVLIFRAGQTSLTGTGTFVVNPTEDGTGDADDEVVQIQAATGTGDDEKTATANLTIQEAISGITISLDMDSFVDTDAETTVTAEVMVTLTEAPSEATSVVVTLTNITDPDGADDDLTTTEDNIGTAEAADFTFTAGDPITVSIDADATSGTAEGTFTITPAADDDDDAEMVVIQAANAGAGQSVRANLTITELISSIALTLSPESFEEGTTTSVLAEAMVTLNAAATAATAVTVAVSDITDPDGADGDLETTEDNIGTAESGDYNTISAFNIVVNISSGATSGSGRALFSFEPTADTDNDSEVAVIQAASSGHTDRANLRISEGEVESVTLALDPTSVMEGADATDVTAEVTVTLNSAVGTGTTVTVAVDLSSAMGTAESGDYTITGLENAQVVIDGDATAPANMTSAVTVTFEIDPMKDGDLDNEMVQITAMAGEMSAMETITITDDGVSAGKIQISVSLDEIRENVRARDVVVTATLSEGTGPLTVMVTTELMGNEGEMTTLPTGTIQIPAGGNSGTTTLSIDPSDDDMFTSRTIMVKGSADDAGYESGSDTITVLDDDTTVGEVKISAAPPSLTVGSGSQTVNLTVNVIGQTDTPEGTMVTVSLSTDAGTLSTDMVTVTLTNDPNKDPATYRTQTRTGAHRGSATLTVDAGSTAGVVATVTGMADGYSAGTRAISALSRDAQDIAGYRVLITKPGSGAWTGVGDKKVIVEIVRLGGIAYPWTAFGSIRVSLRDTATAHDGLEVADALTASNINDDNGAITFTKSGTKGKISYVSATDRLKFELQISNNNVPRGNPDSNPTGQYMGVYAAAEFAISGTTTTLTNRQTDTPVYPSSALLATLVPNEAERYVGDGILIKVDTVKPDNNAITAVVVTSGDEVGSAIAATTGDEIRVAIGISSSSRLFRYDGIQAQLRVRANTAQFMGMTIRPTIELAHKTANYTALQVVNAARSSDSLYVTWDVTEGLFKGEVDDFVEGIGNDGTRFVADNAQAYVRVRVKDQAPNWSGWKNSAIFDVDSRSPAVTIRYPSADPDSIYDHTHPLRFTGKAMDIYNGQNVDVHLNPLVIEVDEDLSKLEVFAVGADTLDISDQFSSSSIGDSTVTYDTSMLNSPKKDDDGNFKPSSGNRAGTEIDLTVLATDILGNTTKAMISGVTHDAARPMITDWFPKNSLLPEDQINDATPPVFTLSEDVDSIAVSFSPSSGSAVVVQRGGVTTKGEDSVDFSGMLKQDESYTMTIFVRDLAGNVYSTPADSSSNLRFNANFDNPTANRFKISAMDSVIAGQANILMIQAEDHNAESNATRNALTHKNMARISAWDADGGVAESVWFEGTGVDDNADSPDGMAMLSAADWRIGKRSVTVKSNRAVGSVKILVQHVDSGMGDTAVLGFESSKNVYVGAADFAGFEITAWEEGAEGAVKEVWGDYTLRVVPIDRHGNPSVRAFKADPAGDDADSLDVLDTRASNAYEYKNGIDVEIIGVPAIEDFALLILSIGKEGESYDLVAPDNRRSQTVQVRIVNESLMDGDSRSENIRSTAKFNISAPLTPMLTLWVPGSDMDEAGNDVVIPADGEITVTVAAEGFNAGDMVAFTRNGEDAGTMEANDDGVATLMITASMAGTTTVSATNGRYSADELTIAFVDTPPEPARKSYADADGNPVYLISDADMTVGVDDFLALVAAFGSSDGDANYNAQADVDDDGDVDVDDFLEFVMSFGRTAVGPATKPLVLLPGMNENAEFALSLGSERVVAGELVAVDVSLANVAALVGYGFALNYETDKFEFVSVAPADEDLLKSTGGETLFHHVVADGQITVANGLYNGTAVSGGGDVVRFVFRVLREFEDNARFEIADGLVFDPSQLQNPAVVAGVLELQSTPREFALHQNFPNPFNPDTTIKYDLAESADVTLQIYNVLGQVIRTLVASEAQNAGRYQIRWNGMDDRGVPVSSGIYFYQISADGKFSDVRKLMLLK